MGILFGSLFSSLADDEQVLAFELLEDSYLVQKSSPYIKTLLISKGRDGDILYEVERVVGGGGFEALRVGVVHLTGQPVDDYTIFENKAGLYRLSNGDCTMLPHDYRFPSILRTDPVSEAMRNSREWLADGGHRFEVNRDVELGGMLCYEVIHRYPEATGEELTRMIDSMERSYRKNAERARSEGKNFDADRDFVELALKNRVASKTIYISKRDQLAVGWRLRNESGAVLREQFISEYEIGSEFNESRYRAPCEGPK